MDSLQEPTTCQGEDWNPESLLTRGSGEVLEETGLRASVVRTIGSRSYLLDPDSGKQDKILIVYVLRVTEGGFKITLSEEHDEYRWVSDSELGGIFGSGDLMRNIIHEYFISESSC